MKRGKIGANGKRKRDIDYAKILKQKFQQRLMIEEHLIYGRFKSTHKILFFLIHFCPILSRIL